MEKIHHIDVEQARKGILENVFGKTIHKGVVIQAFQHLGSGNSVEDTDVFYDYDDDEKKIFLKPKAHEFFKQNYGLLTRALLAEWIKYLYVPSLRDCDIIAKNVIFIS